MDSEEHLRDILELREWISEEIEKREKEIDKFRQNIRILDSIVKQSSFSKASSLVSSSNKPVTQSKQESSVIPIKSQDRILANAHVTSDEMVIIPSEDITLDVETNPFKSFFLGRIIGGMENQDRLDAQNGKIPQNTMISCLVNKDGGKIREILIKNYRQKERVSEIINTVTWSFSRMLENSQK
ncbi:conserved hypothetical protein [Nitrosotalea sinensis]|jgi:hypothetical protein|uniref:Uncharacterized protein n=1 Tax=Nitrosotalea sinensis TaxID=1499975 RepID=A0A2H1EFQ6_9ARCH|nr:hypothetical protein [Candidatus Nitrosotalea sinensis]SHO44135.1 conserved hypothetical protein [Candidatus Nitrosotalea sinensis]